MSRGSPPLPSIGQAAAIVPIGHLAGIDGHGVASVVVLVLIKLVLMFISRGDAPGGIVLNDAIRISGVRGVAALGWLTNKPIALALYGDRPRALDCSCAVRTALGGKGRPAASRLSHGLGDLLGTLGCEGLAADQLVLHLPAFKLANWVMSS